MCLLLSYITLVHGLLARSQYSEGPATGHLDTGFSWFPCVCKQMLRWFPTFQVATTCFSCSPPDLNFLDPYLNLLYPYLNLLYPYLNLLDPCLNILDPCLHILDPYLNLLDPYLNFLDPYLNLLDPYFIFMHKHNNHCHRATAHLHLNIIILLLLLLLYKHAVRNSMRKQFVSITKTNTSMLSRKTVTVYFEYHAESN